MIYICCVNKLLHYEVIQRGPFCKFIVVGSSHKDRTNDVYNT